MSPVARAAAQAFLADMLLILPMLGITAFTPYKPLARKQRYKLRALSKKKSSPLIQL
jgi:hypothetical protein